MQTQTLLIYRCNDDGSDGIDDDDNDDCDGG